MLKRSFIFVHRWLGVVLCVVFLLWFPSGFVLMYWDFPSVGPRDRLDHAPVLDRSTIRVSPMEAASKAGLDPPGQVRLETFDGRPVYRFGGGGGEALIYADSGEEQVDVPRTMVDRIAAAWTGLSPRDARIEAVTAVDQWTVQIRLADLQPVWKYSWPDGQQVYVSQASGDVVQYTTTATRWAAYLGAIPHWLYFTPLRRHGPTWSRVVIWTSAAGTVSAILGLVIGVWMYSPSRRYRRQGRPTSIPYRGQKRWHTIFGLMFGASAVTWAFSGLLSMEPFPLQRRPEPARDRRGAPTIPQALRGRPAPLSAYAAKGPDAALAEIADLRVKALELTTVAGEPMYLATLEGGDTRIVPVNGAPRREIDRQRLVDIVAGAAEPDGGADVAFIDRYDRYYLDRRGERPLPVLLVRLRDAERTRYYIDPKTARLVGAYRSGAWIERWLYHGLHSLDFPWLYANRPLWDVVVITFLSGGTALCVTSLVLAWRVLGRALARTDRTADGADIPA